jgi:hypothetical protein
MLIARSLMERDGMEKVTDKELDETLAFIDYTAIRLTHSSVN